MLDTGSTNSFVDPLLIQPKNIQALSSPITIKTALDKHTITERTAWKMPQEFNRTDNGTENINTFQK